MMDEDELIDLYFDQMLMAIDENEISQDWHFEVCSTHISPELIAKYQLHKCDNEWVASHTKMEEWRDHIRKLVKKMIALDHEALGQVCIINKSGGPRLYGI